MGDAQLDQLVCDDAEDEGEGAGHLRRVEVLADGAEDESLAQVAVQVLDENSNAVLYEEVGTRLIYYLGLTRLVFFQRVPFSLSRGKRGPPTKSSPKTRWKCRWLTCAPAPIEL